MTRIITHSVIVSLLEPPLPHTHLPLLHRRQLYPAVESGIIAADKISAVLSWRKKKKTLRSMRLINQMTLLSLYDVTHATTELSPNCLIICQGPLLNTLPIKCTTSNLFKLSFQANILSANHLPDVMIFSVRQVLTKVLVSQ